VSDDEWKDYAKGLIKAEIARKNISLIDLSKKLETMGISETPDELAELNFIELNRDLAVSIIDRLCSLLGRKVIFCILNGIFENE